MQSYGLIYFVKIKVDLLQCMVSDPIATTYRLAGEGASLLLAKTELSTKPRAIRSPINQG